MKAFTSNQIWSFLTINLFRNLWCDKIGQYWPNSKLTNWLIHWPCHRLGCVKIQGKITTNYKLLVFTCFDKVFDVIEFGITFLNPIYHLRGKLLYWRVRAMPFQSTFMNLQRILLYDTTILVTLWATTFIWRPPSILHICHFFYTTTI